MSYKSLVDKILHGRETFARDVVDQLVMLNIKLKVRFNELLL